MKIEKEDFEQWRDNPVTEQVFARLRQLAERAKEEWLAASWGKGILDPQLLADLRARAEVANDFCELTYEEVTEDEPERDQSDGIQGADPSESG